MHKAMHKAMQRRAAGPMADDEGRMAAFGFTVAPNLVEAHARVVNRFFENSETAASADLAELLASAPWRQNLTDATPCS